MFRSAAEGAEKETAARKDARKDLRKFGIDFLDDALLGIAPSDLVLVGAPSGMGKTQLCCNIALKNIADGKRVHFVALEAEEWEVERRLKYQIIASAYFADPERPHLGGHLTYDRWVLGDWLGVLAKYERQATEFMKGAYSGLFVHYKADQFTLENLIESVSLNSHSSDLFIIDHAHYFDLDEDRGENRALKELAKTVRALALEQKKPIILVAHLRKRDRANEDLVPGIDEFHGSSDLAKIATKIVTIAPGGRTADGRFETFFRIPKNRMNGGCTRFIGRIMFNPRTNSYEYGYKVGSSSLTRKEGFAELDHGLYPDWARRQTLVGAHRGSNDA